MKIIQSLCAVSILATGHAHALTECYSISGSMTAITRIAPATYPPTYYVHAGSTGYSTSPSVFPSFSSPSWCIDTSMSSPTLSGIFGDFVPYSISFNILGGLGTAVVNQRHMVFAFSGGSTSWAFAGPGITLTLGQPLSLAGTISQTSDAILDFDADYASAGTCQSSFGLCSEQDEAFIAYPDLESFYLTLTISPDGNTLSGSAVALDHNEVTNTLGHIGYSFSFTGTKL